MKGFFYRLKGSAHEEETPAEDTFHVNLGELRDAMGYDRDDRTDRYTLAIEYEADDGDDGKQNQRRRWF